ncbi:hypothetical protein TNCV_3148701 [Trichonephila clavipes]|nr:hypothetical protein TNCV_3148701 [Trichonephila clavipes]
MRAHTTSRPPVRSVKNDSCYFRTHPIRGLTLRIIRERSTCVIGLEISGFLLNFLEESRVSDKKNGRQHGRQVTKMVAKMAANSPN